jgi:hypothetical protein
MTPPEDVTTGYLLWRVATKWRAAVDRAVAPLGLTHAQYSLLASLYGLSRSGTAPASANWPTSPAWSRSTYPSWRGRSNRAAS